MPNWCYSYYVIQGDEKEINDLHTLLTELDEAHEPRVKSDFGNTWLGCLVDALGLNWKEVGCRGLYICLERDDEETISLQTETAWGPCNEVFDAICEKFPSLSYWYQAEEPGCGIYWTNDTEQLFFHDKYYINIEGKGNDYSQHYVSSDEELFKYLSKCFEKSINSFEEIEQLKEEFMKKDENNFLCIEEFICPS